MSGAYAIPSNEPIVIKGADATRFVCSQDFRNRDYKLYGLRNIWAIERKWNEKLLRRKPSKKIKFGDSEFESSFACEIRTLEDLTPEELASLPPRVSHEEKDHWLEMEERYLGEMTLTFHGWDAFVKYCNWPLHKEATKKLVSEHRPCECQDGQCNLLCPALIEGNGCDIEELYDGFSL